MCSLLVPAPSIATAATCDDPGSAPGLGIISEAVNVLSTLYVEPLAPSNLFATAAEATRSEVQRRGTSGLVPDPPKTFGDDNGTTARFASYFCQLYDTGVEVDPTATAYAGIRAMTSSVNEGHTRFFTPEMYRAHQASLSGDERFEGIGATLRSNPLTIEYVFPESPAERAGLRGGDQIVSIDGQPSGSLSAEEAVQLVRGAAGTPVVLGLRRQGNEAELSITVVREVVRIPTVVSAMVEDIGHLRIRSFPGTPIHEEIADELAWFNAAGARGLILDLRGNSGGRLDIGTRVASLFVPEGAPIYRQTTRSGRTTSRASSNGPTWNKPLVVLIDQGTASMGEILAAALKEQAGATLIGSTTAGAVAGSIVVPLSDGSAIQVTTLRIDSSLGTILNVVGVQPDVSVQSPAGSSSGGANDPVLAAALAYLHRPVQASSSALPEQSTAVAGVAG